jgi:hypothetical protein
MPADRLDLLRRSYLEMVADKDFREEAERHGIPIGRAMSGAEIHKLIIEDLSALPQSVVKEYLSLMQ